MKTRKVRVQKRRETAPPAVSRAPEMMLCAAIGFAVLIVYTQTFSYGFLSFDDGAYVYQNAMVKAGLSLRGLGWAFTTFSASNWHPLTWISLMLDNSLFGLNPGAEHAISVFFHLGSSILLFLTLERMTKRRWCSALVAGIFALHPLHVESVAWIAERKDVLSTFFEMLTLWFYVRYTEDPKPIRYARMAGAFALSLLAKPMAVTLPFVMILLDDWPLGRRRALREKVPLFAMSAAASILTLLAQRNTGAMSLTRLSFAARVGNAAIAYLRYIEKSFWPTNLGVLYPIHRPSLPAVLIAVLILTAITVVAGITHRQRPYLMTGWLWFLGMLVPVIGLVQVGYQSIADRYTYVPLVGLSIALIWTAAEIAESQPRLRAAWATAAAVAMLALAIAAYRQAEYWKDSITLFEHTLAVTDGNYVIHNDLGIDLQSAGRLNDAAEQFRLAVDAAPDYKDALNSLGAILEYKGDKSGAIALHRRAIAVDPNYPGAHFNLGHELFETGQTQEAFAELTRGLQLQPDSARGHAYLGAVLITMDKLEQARQQFEQSLRLAPENASVQNNLCSVLQSLGRPAQEIAACRATVQNLQRSRLRRNAGY